MFFLIFRQKYDIITVPVVMLTRPLSKTKGVRLGKYGFDYNE